MKTLTHAQVDARDAFLNAAQDVRRRHGGRPIASLEDGRIVFTYPDGTVTCGGERLARRFFELHDDMSTPLTICATCAPQARREGFRIGARILTAATCDSCGAQS